MAKKKLIHFRENLAFPHLFQPAYDELDEGFALKSHWQRDFFHNDHPIVLELGCGKGEYTVGLALKYKERNFVGIDLKGARLWRGCKTVAEEKITNAAFIRSRADHLEKFFSPKEVSEIWITFPDPQPGKERKRLTSPVFIDKYRNILSENGIIHLKTDNFDFFSYTLDVIREYNHKLLYSTQDLYHTGSPGEVTAIQTYYEKIWLEKGKKICYLKFRIQ